MTFNRALQLLPVQHHGEFRVVGYWAYNINTGVASNSRTGEKMRFKNWEELVIEKLLLEKFIPEWEMQQK